MKDLLIGILLGVLCVMSIFYFLELKRLDIVKQGKQKIITVDECIEFDGIDNFIDYDYRRRT